MKNFVITQKVRGRELHSLRKVLLTAAMITGSVYGADEIIGAYKSDDVSLDSSISSLINPNNTPIFNEPLYSIMEFQAFQYRDYEHAFIDDVESFSPYADPPLDYFSEVDDNDVELIPIQ